MTTQRRSRGGAYHWREYKIEEYLPPAEQAPRVLLLGCGDAGERAYLEDLGFSAVAFDIRPAGGADFLADAHRLPLREASFDVVLSMQVLEHLHSPWTAVAEIARVLRPTGWFVGSVAFLKAYHKSYYHMTHKAVMHLLGSHGLHVDRVAGAQSLSFMLFGNLLPVGTRSLRRRFYGVFDGLLHRFRASIWSIRSGLDPDEPTDRFDKSLRLSFREFDRLRFAPSVVFRAHKMPSELSG